MVDIDITEKAKQVPFSQMVGVSQPAVAKMVEKGVLVEGASYHEWLVAYCGRLRDEAAGRTPSDARERRDLAQAFESELKAQAMLREMLKQDGQLLDYDSTRALLIEWATQAKNELTNTIMALVRAIESQHGITVDSEIPQSHIDAAARVIGDHALQSPAIGDGREDGVDPAA